MPQTGHLDLEGGDPAPGMCRVASTFRTNFINFCSG
jgi:hypothetical protein